MTREELGRSRQPRGYHGRGRGRGRRGSHRYAPDVASPPPAPIQRQGGPIRGECQAFCPPEEAAERARNQELSRFERPAAACEGLVAVKKYRRAAAGRDVWDPKELRPAPVLLQTLRHLFTKVLPWPQSGFDKGDSAQAVEFLSVYHFVNDRVRSVRQDFTVQRIEDISLVTALQQAARFYLLTGLRSVQLLTVKTQDWSDKLNDEQLTSALSQLQALYGMHALAGFNHEDIPELKDAGEFIAYDLLLHADRPQDVAWMLLKLSPSLRRLPEVQRALRAFVALQTDDFHAFFSGFKAMTVLERAISLRHLPKIWTRSLRMMNKGFGKQDRFPLEELGRWLGLAEGEHAERLCKGLNIQTQRHPTMNDVADSWEAEDSKPSSIGFAQFKLAPLHDQIDSEVVRHLLRDLTLQLEAGEDSISTTELIIGEKG